MSRFPRSLIVVCCVSLWLPAVRTALAQPPETPVPAAPQEVIAPVESVPAIPPPTAPAPELPGAAGPQGPAEVAPSPASFDAKSGAVAAVYEKIEQALNATAEADFNDTPLSEVASYLRDTYQIPIIFDKRALDNVGMGSDTPVTISIHGISLRSVLRLMLKELGLTYVVRDQVLKITTPEEAENELITRVYPVADLAVGSRPSLVVEEPESDYRTIQRLVSDSIAPDSWNEVGGAASAWSFDPLMTAISGVVGPGTWGSAPNGPAMFPLGTHVLIRQTPAAHAEIRELIEGLRPHKGSRDGVAAPAGSGGMF